MERLHRIKYLIQARNCVPLNIFLDEYSNNLIQHYESYNPLFNDNELKRLIWEEWESEIKEEDPRQMVFKYMKLMRDQFIKE